MPLTFKKYVASANVKVDDPDEFENLYQLRINIDINTYALSPSICAKLVAEFHKILVEHAENLIDVTSSVVDVEIPTLDEIEAKNKKWAEDYVSEVGETNAIDPESPGLVALIIADQQAKSSWAQLKGRKLELVNALLDEAGYCPVSEEDWRD